MMINLFNRFKIMAEIILVALLDEYLILLNKAEHAESQKEKEHQLELLRMKMQGLQDMLMKSKQLK